MDLYKIRQQLNMGIPLTKIKLRVTDYSRVSTDSKEQKSSLNNQITHFDEMIKNNPNWQYIKGYKDEGISGTTDIKRTNFMQMISDAKKGLFDLIITKEISRFSRNTLDSIKYTRELLSYGVCVLFINDNINTVMPDSELRLTIMASMAQDEIRRLSERVKFGMHEAIKKGSILGNNKLYGYKKENNKFKIVKEEAKVVKDIFELYVINKQSLSSIVKKLNNENLSDKKWSITTITRMIQNPKYKGYYCGRKSEVVDYMSKKVKIHNNDEWFIYKDKRFPIIIKEELWNLANDRLNKRKTNNINKELYKNRYPFSAKIVCYKDNEVYHRRKQCKKTKDITWMCAKYLKEGKKSCNSANIRERELYHIIKDIIKSKELDLNLNIIKQLLINIYNIDLTTPIERELKTKEFINYLIGEIVDKIIVNKINENSIDLQFVLTKIFPKKSFFKKYIFKRGYKIKGTKHYKIFYYVKI